MRSTWPNVPVLMDTSIQTCTRIRGGRILGLLFRAVRGGDFHREPWESEMFVPRASANIVVQYASPLLDRIDPDSKCPWRLYRDSCLLWQGNYVKDLSKLGRDLKDVLIVDVYPCSHHTLYTAHTRYTQLTHTRYTPPLSIYPLSISLSVYLMAEFAS